MMVLINLSASTVNAQVNLYVDNGGPLTLPLTFPQFGSTASASSQAVTIDPNDSVVIASNSSSSSVGVGWADVLATGRLSGYLTFGVTSGGTTSVASVPLDTRLSSALLLPYDNTNGYQTGLALANQSATAQTVMVTLLDQDGNQLTSTPVNLAAFGHTSFFMSSQFPQSANQLGVIEFQGSRGVTGVGLRFSPTGTFTSIPIIC